MKINNKVLFIILFILIILSISGAVFVFQDKVLFLKDWIINIKKGKDKDLNQGPIAQKIPQTPNVNQYKDIKINIATSSQEVATSTVEDVELVGATTTNDIINTITTYDAEVVYGILKDTDGDTLYDYEEMAVFGTDYLNPDTDGDGFNDHEEVDGGYNPLGEGRLATNSPIFLLKTIERARHNCEGLLYKNKIYYLTVEILKKYLEPEDFSDLSIASSVENFNNEINNWLESNILVNDIKKIAIINKEEVDKDKIKFEYRIFYATQEYEYVFSEDKKLYFINIDGEWKVDAYLSALEDVSLEKAEIELVQKKTISNIKKIQTALDMYYLDNGVYPENIYPDIATGSTIYLSTPFNQSEPLMCPEAEEYDYKVGVTKKDYSLIYCLEKEIENTPSGINIASPSILSNRIKNKVVYKDCKQDNNISTSTIEDMKIQEEKISTTSAEKIDSDQDGLLDIEELFYKTDPNNPDTDGDGYIDGDEVRGGYNPNGDGLLI
ncbi:hypothetical protein A2331_02010 [Candidatus Falkowbacteria bacterium RIFOXYB2_FULL_34_18]|uniref:EF-hand domain-containing protein n=1 Tax=Candidatus Falkowbacteria bacterium RIFOXYD2_FULL_34_120 TaxID=1798007 RepID=A0A1F5TQY8_9BACT|nr:MAG: hypothetical protein A2331_02010 [Candidatus Falkowbacteria bacterium RIFOXYB2_FULL_34_18]OGF29455.1 MAG: hypothetical protein A2500_01070 [Candidatus Falkowbacteria bacterium RIFOXYC12_FULL_34_55]OGF36768.1 MAG: hypothetical protein A2466_03380 [Candidatus Falkowbacteria bacterium RIFOXYC2_FULL_34_220]OGF38981.1 MAG: hypothetical protein A2515_05495 [Candidatus Falkowbacteria bacterium RIFOXYD12_FULL_34_57]OGF41174.1 MAG: hypothetical protein A2531_01500 [Candidatus Falkowbacteria bact